VKAAVLTEFGRPLELLEVTVDAPDPGEVLIRVAACGVCHSDRNLAAGGLPASPRPQVLGHEVAGVVERVGAGVVDFAPGDRVVTCPAASCGRCEWCRDGLLHLCTDKGRTRPEGRPGRLHVDGAPVAQMAGLGGFAEQMLVSERAVAAVPDDLPLDRAALLGCAVVTGMGAVLYTAAVRAGQRVAVIGCGGVGLNVVQAARLAGARSIVAVDIDAAKLARARHFGATDVVDASAADPVDRVRALTGGGVDHAFEVVGGSGTIEAAFAMLRPRGTATVLGVAHPDARVGIGALALLDERRLQGSQLGSTSFRHDVALFAELYLQGRILLDELISERIALADVNEAMASMDDSSGARQLVTFAA
jgi:S-(hydroxymethyl)glutathione dehydrogenase/alcohol dehydrogenase